MADRKISDLTALTTPATGDLIPIVDISEAAAADKNKSITVGELLRGAPDGTAAAPGFAFESDGGNGMFLGGTDILAFSTGGTQAVTIDASQRVGLGTTSPAAILHSKPATSNGAISPAFIATQGGSGAGTGTSIRLGYSSVDGGYSEIAGAYNDPGTYLQLRTSPDNSTAATTRLHINASGNVGIGTTSPGQALHVVGLIQADSGGNYLQLQQATNDSYINNTGSGGIIFRQGTGFTERARIDSSGRLFVGCTSNVGVNTTRVDIQAVGGGAEYGLGIDLVTLNAGTQWIEFSGGGTGNRGNIDWSGTTVRYNTTSDYRLKENIVPLVDSISRIKKLKPCRYRLIEFPDQTVDGFIAHEAQIAVPEAVTGEKDAVDDDGNPVYQGIDQSKLVPLLTAALQEALAKIETLEARVTALEP